MVICRETFPSERVSLLPIKGKVFSIDPYASEKTTEILFFYSSFSPKDSFPLLLFCIVSFIEVYSVETLVLNKIRKKVSDGIEKKAPYLIILLSYIKTTLS